jgi:hypothetical protein
MRRQKILPVGSHKWPFGPYGDIPANKVTPTKARRAKPPSRKAALTNDELGRLWLKHFPMRHLDPDSCQVCYGIVAIIKFKADLDRRGTYADSIQRMLDGTGILEEEFAQVKAESARGIDRFA